MKYIRSIEGKIEEVIAINEDDGSPRVVGGHAYRDRSYILKEADDVEELFDATVFVGEDGRLPVFVKRLHEEDDKDRKLTECILDIGGWLTWLGSYPRKGVIYGAIWTKKGLIYVAEMNKEGGFDLL